MATQELPGVRVVAILYRVDRLAERDERAIDAYQAAGVYEAARVPVEIVEPQFPEHKRSGEITDNLGVLGGVIADAVAEGRRAGHGT